MTLLDEGENPGTTRVAGHGIQESRFRFLEGRRYQSCERGAPRHTHGCDVISPHPCVPFRWRQGLAGTMSQEGCWEGLHPLNV